MTSKNEMFGGKIYPELTCYSCGRQTFLNLEIIYLRE